MGERSLDFQQRVRQKDLTVAIVGLGYVGLPLAVGLARAGVRVCGIDVDAARVARLNRGESHIPWILTHSRLLVDATGVTRRFSSAGGTVIRL